MEQSVYLKILQALINISAILYHCFMITLGIVLCQQPEQYLYLAGYVVLAYDAYTILIQYYENTVDRLSDNSEE